MLITNHTRFCLAVNANEFVGFISPESSLEVPADVAETWLQRSTPAALKARGLITLTKDVVMDAVFETPDVPKKTGWREAVEAVDAMTDLDALTELHATETRKRVLKAIEARMEALNGG